MNTIYAQCIDTTLINPEGFCEQLYDPVCGCNGKTYENACAAEINGVTSTTLGICPITQTYTNCAATDLQIGIFPNSSSTYSWSPTDNLICADCANTVVNPVNTTIYELTTTDNTGISTYTYFEIIVEPCPSQTDTICLGDNVQIGEVGDTLNTYLWSPTNDLSCTDCANPVASPTSSTVYELISTAQSGTTLYTYYEIIVEPCAPETSTICLGDSTQIGVVADTLNTYIWSPANNLTCTDCANPSANPTTTTTYQLTTTDTSGNSTNTYFEVVVEQCISVCENNNGFSYQFNDIAKTGNGPANQIDLVIDFTQNFQSDNACQWSWDFGNGTTSSERNPTAISFSTLKDGAPVAQAYEVCMSVFNCSQQLIETCCQSIGPYVPCEDGSLVNAVQNCNNTVEPICGCNNKSYPSICNAVNTDGVHNWSDGPCNIDDTYQICAGQSVPIGLPNFISGVQYSWYPNNSVSCNAACHQTTASPSQSTLYQLTMTNNATGEKTYKYYQVDVLDVAYCCTSNNLSWVDALIDDDFCNECYSEVKQIEIDGFDYIYLAKDTASCSNATSLLTYCNGNVFCNEDSTGFCLDTINYTVVENIWSKATYCNLCDASDVNEISWLYNTYGNGDYEVSQYSFNNDIAFYIEKCNPLPADTIDRMLVNCNNELLCGWDRFTSVIDNASCSNFSSQGIFIEQVISCGCIDPSLIDPSKNCGPFNAQICGCDGKTYINFCTGQKVGGITSWTFGACNTNVACVDTLKILDGFLETDELKAKHLLQVGVPVVGNNIIKLKGEQTIEIVNGFECPKNATFEIQNETCY